MLKPFSVGIRPFLVNGILDNSQKRTKRDSYATTESDNTPFNYSEFPWWSSEYNNPLMECVEDLQNGTTPSMTKVVNDFFSNGVTIFGPNPFWVALECPQLISEDYYEGFAVDLIYDTLNYIATGKRAVSLSVLEELMDDESEQWILHGNRYSPQRLGIEPNFDCLKGLTSQELFQKWIGRNGGWEDVITAKQLLIANRWID